MQDRSINVGGSFQGVANSGDNSVIYSGSNSSANRDVCEFLVDMLTELAQRYPNASEAHRRTVLQMELEQKMVEDPTLKQRFLSAAKAGGFELVKILTNNPFVSVPMETAKGWFEVKPN
jgi:hypothetical protein